LALQKVIDCIDLFLLFLSSIQSFSVTMSSPLPVSLVARLAVQTKFPRILAPTLAVSNCQLLCSEIIRNLSYTVKIDFVIHAHDGRSSVVLHKLSQ